MKKEDKEKKTIDVEESAHQIPFSPSAVFDRTSARGIRITVRPTLIRLQS